MQAMINDTSKVSPVLDTSGMTGRQKKMAQAMQPLIPLFVKAVSEQIRPEGQAAESFYTAAKAGGRTGKSRTKSDRKEAKKTENPKERKHFLVSIVYITRE